MVNAANFENMYSVWFNCHISLKCSTLFFLVPEGCSSELESIGRDGGDHVDSIIGHGPDAGGASVDNGAWCSHNVGGHIPHEASATGHSIVSKAGEGGGGPGEGAGSCSQSIVGGSEGGEGDSSHTVQSSIAKADNLS